MSPTADPTVPSSSREGSGLDLHVRPSDNPSAVVALGGQGSGGRIVTTPLSMVPEGSTPEARWLSGGHLVLPMGVDGPPVLGDRLGLVASPIPTVVGCGAAPAFKVAGCLPSFLV